MILPKWTQVILIAKRELSMLNVNTADAGHFHTVIAFDKGKHDGSIGNNNTINIW
jgi:hypothetical protein